MERHDRETVASFLIAEEALTPGSTLALGEEIARHVRARRLHAGAQVLLLDGQGHQALGTLVRLHPHPAVEVQSLAVSAALPAVHLIVPIADKDRMLLLAEKATELGATSWRPVMFKRSRSVRPRGEGPMFNAKVRARMASALEQSGGRWLPVQFPESTLARTVAALPALGTRIVCDPAGTSLTGVRFEAPVTVAVGPEGGLDDEELALLVGAGFQAVSLPGPGILRFETAAIAATALVRAHL